MEVLPPPLFLLLKVTYQELENPISLPCTQFKHLIAFCNHSKNTLSPASRILKSHKINQFTLGPHPLWKVRAINPTQMTDWFYRFSAGFERRRFAEAINRCLLLRLLICNSDFNLSTIFAPKNMANGQLLGIAHNAFKKIMISFKILQKCDFFRWIYKTPC